MTMEHKRVDIMNNHRIDEELYSIFINTQQSSGSSLDMISSKISSIIENELSENQAEVLNAYYFDGLKQKDIAKLLNKDQSTVSRTLKRAKNNLIRILKYLIN